MNYHDRNKDEEYSIELQKIDEANKKADHDIQDFRNKSYVNQEWIDIKNLLYDFDINKQWLICCSILNVISFVSVMLSCGFPLAKFKNGTDFLTLLFFVQNEEGWDWHFYLKFSRTFNHGDDSGYCQEIIFDDLDENNICAILKKSVVANSILLLGLVISLIFKAFIIYFVL